jgi:hypothetical protein
MEKENEEIKSEPSKKKPANPKKKRACKIGGLWVDRACFPKLTQDEKDPQENR